MLEADYMFDLTISPFWCIPLIMTTTKVSSRKRLTAKQEAFAVNYFKLRNATQAAIQAGYSPHLIDTNVSHLLDNTRIRERIAECEKKAEDDAVGTVVERKQKLTEVYRATVADFVDENGNLSISGKDKLNTPAVAEIRTERTLMGVKTTLKLRDPIAAIAEQNKMERIGAQDNNTNNFHDIRILIVREPQTAKDMPTIEVSPQ